MSFVDEPAPPRRRMRDRLRKPRFWIVLGLVVTLVLGWSMTLYFYDRSQDNADLAIEATAASQDLERQLDTMARDRDDLATKKKAIEDAEQARADAAAKRDEAAKKREDEVAAREAAAQKRDEELKAREAAVTQQETIQAQNTITEGTWAVGVDVQAGTYRTKEAVSDSCYWGIYADANGRNIIANDIVTGGRPTVTLRNSQFFKSERCGSWVKV